jgi:hypothetical protein
MQKLKNIIHQDIAITVIAIGIITLIWWLTYSVTSTERPWQIISLQLVGQIMVLAWQNRAFKVNRIKHIEELRAMLRGHSTDDLI